MKWMTIRAAAKYLKEEGNDGMFSESSIRTLVRFGFPCVHIGNRILINIDTFFEDLKLYSDARSSYYNKNNHCNTVNNI